VDFPPSDDVEWDLPADCKTGDMWTDFTLPTKLQYNPYLFNLRDRMVARCKADGAACGAHQAPAGYNNASNTSANTTGASGRRLLDLEDVQRSMSDSFMAAMEDTSSDAQHDAGRIMNPAQKSSPATRRGRRHLLVGADCAPEGSCNGNWNTDVLEIEVVPEKYKFTMETWKGGCALKSLLFEGQCGNGLTCYGTCSGTTTLLCQSPNSLSCGVGIKFDAPEVGKRSRTLWKCSGPRQKPTSNSDTCPSPPCTSRLAATSPSETCAAATAAAAAARCWATMS
jgi:hypothetical protein